MENCPHLEVEFIPCVNKFQIASLAINTPTGLNSLHVAAKGSQMTKVDQMSEQDQAATKMKAARLRQEHDDYHAAIDAMITVGCNPLQVQRMKKKKLDLKDQLTILEDSCIPDIIA